MDLELIVEGSSFTIYGIVSGDSVKEFLEELRVDDADEYARIDRRITQMAEQGSSRRLNEFNDLGNGLYEMKTKGGTRIVFFYDEGRLVICTHGFAKKSQRTPKRHLEVARDRKRDYEQHRERKGRFRLLIGSEQDIPERKP